uniref:cation transporter n=1 Tax=Candidatus Fimenecus sp. TaxID=3022888 RepID=UPI0015BA8331
MYKTIAKVDGMRCGMCESHVNDVVRRNFDVKKVNASHAKGEVVIVSEQPVDEQKLRFAVGEQGYAVGTVTSEEYKQKGLFGWLKK